VESIGQALRKERELERRDVAETRDGVCRLGAEIARQLAASASQLRRGVVAEVRQVRSRLLGGGSLGSSRSPAWHAINGNEVTPPVSATDARTNL